MNINVDERQMGSLDLTEDVLHLLKNYKLPPSCLRLEVTEGVFRSGSAHASKQLAELKELGVGLAVDDFGTGYSSLEAFASSSFDALKVDQSCPRPRRQSAAPGLVHHHRPPGAGLLLTAEESSRRTTPAAAGAGLRIRPATHRGGTAPANSSAGSERIRHPCVSAVEAR
jgi:hypothetical protein